MGGRTDRIRGRAAAAVTGALTALTIALPQAGCAEQPSGTGVVLSGNRSVSVHFEPAYGDLTVRPVAPSGR